MSENIIQSILIAAFIFVLSAGAGAGLVMHDPMIGDTVMQVLAEALDLEALMEEPPLMLAAMLFMNNLQACIILFLGGVTFGILTIFVLATNGVIVGAVAQISNGLQGVTYVVAALLPHGIFELPALFISGALGLMLSGAIQRELFEGGDAAIDARRYTVIFAKTVLPLLLLAAITEAFITPGIIVMVV
ncbi:MAG: Stage II sporulation protein M [Methanomicrobiales archaeon 53_19]|uniref:stage II sporulation protein M n=1 Tax=Methanocalculus sp. TaxID=2004547 RepID=UPI00074987A6|nr:stage II sporulation protein M [Methanocalculus sp.]KUK70820.1 MAG: Stage II sporulation protein M [Methanocalculus sp. 52_23]KUL04015.1 MAG: Stage II sporulation protein M [Methanomicrobiales archaeon 53_19]HIJ06758.1 stage II sporulation protein M [Methanocalculus sp.]